MVMAIPLELSLACPTIHRVKDPSDPCSLDVSASNQSSAHPYIPYKLHGTQNPPQHIENKVQYQQRLGQGSDHSAKSCTLINKTCSGSHGKREPVGIQGAPLSLFLAHQCGPASAVGNGRKRGSTMLERGADCSSFSESFDHDRTGDDGSSRGSEEEAQGRRLVVRKKLRLSKEESALLEEKFEEHSTLTPVSSYSG
ncbi:hypothetical protein KP509_04G000400 [Ceratopteris richardii]|uniref:Uncharacterized protein n=1 Tax=Ceratopteris richardii TaxID=49495 RepID=A0A8T2UWH9_CERRI|nr:hypothetical protein KP509_04G000400 [Ceratopteris richardii]